MDPFEVELRVRALRDAVATLEIPPRREDSFARISERRARGERIVLMVADASTGRRLRNIGVGIVLFAGAAALVIAGVVLRRGAALSGELISDRVALLAVDSACVNAPVTTRDSTALRHLMIAAFGVPAACGAEPGQDPPIAFKASQIEPGTFTYSSLSITDGVFTSRHGSSAISVSRAKWRGAPAFLAVRDGPRVTGVHLDSLVVTADGPTPLYWASTYYTQHPPGAIRANFDSASVTIAMTGHLDTIATLPFRMKSGQLPFGFALPLAIPALPLAPGWHGTVEIAPPIHPRAFKFFLRPWETMRLRVVGRETIRVPAGVFDCWKVQVGDPEDESTIWVSTAHHFVIRSVSVGRHGTTTFEDQHELETAVFDSR